MQFPTKFRVVFLILVVSAGCFRYNSDSAILAELVPGPEGGFSENGIAAEYLAFDDELTASVFRGMERRYRIAPTGTPLLCPSNPAEGMHGFNVRGRVMQRVGNQAVGDVEQRCLQPGDEMTISTNYLLTRRNGKWSIEKPLSGSVSYLSMRQGMVIPHMPITANPKRDLQRLLVGIGVSGERHVRIAIRGKGRLEASALSQRGDSVFLAKGDVRHAIGITDVDSVWAQKGSAALLLGAIAATPCVIFGMMVGNFLANDPDGNQGGMTGPVGALIGGVIGGAPCGLLGGAVGSFFRRWRLEYPRPLEQAANAAPEIRGIPTVTPSDRAPRRALRSPLRHSWDRSRG